MEPSIKDVDKKPFLELIEGYSQLKIPAFQRPYTWKPKQLAELWDSILNNPNFYYIGTIFGIPTSSKDLDSSLEIIDGQQRITTLSLILIALRDFVEKEKKNFDDVDGIVNDINRSLVHVPRFSSEKKPVSKIFFWKENINSFYQNLLFHENKIDEKNLDDNQKRLFNNYKKSLSLVKDHFKDSKDYFDTFKKLISKIQSLYIIIIVAKDDINAFQLFEGLNATGLPLSEVDLIKNAIFKSVNSHADNKLAIKKSEDFWIKMETEFEETTVVWFAKYLRHHWISQNGYVNASELFSKVKKNKLSTGDLGEIINYLQNLSVEASLYVTLRTAEKHRIDNENYLKEVSAGGKKELGSLLFRLNMYGVDQIYEVLLALTRKFFEDDKYTENQYILDVKRFTYFSVLAKYTSVVPSVYEKVFASACEKIYSSPERSSSLKKVFKELREMVNKKREEFAQSFSDEFKYRDHSPTRRLIYETLYEIYNYQHKVTQKIKYNEDSVEHIIPQKPDPDSGLTSVGIKDCVHKIGNLTLLDRETNGRLQNAQFQIKMKHFEKDILLANREIVKYKNDFVKDPKAAIEKRGVELGESFYDLALIELNKG